MSYPTPKGEAQGADLSEALAAAVGTNEPPNATELGERLLADTSLLSHVLTRLSGELPVTLVFVIDQAEEMFTLARSPVEESARGRVLEMIRQIGDRHGDFKLIVSLRTEYYGRLASALRRGLSDADGLREYLLADLDVSAMVRAIRRPTSRERVANALEIPFERYRGFSYAENVPETIARQIARHGRTDGVALLLQVICAQLFERAMSRDDHQVTEDDLTAIGGFEGALSRHAKRQIDRLFAADRSVIEVDVRRDDIEDPGVAGPSFAPNDCASGDRSLQPARPAHRRRTVPGSLDSPDAQAGRRHADYRLVARRGASQNLGWPSAV